MDIRAANNIIKRDFLNAFVKKGSKVLDVGCGQGGDLHKWRHIGVNLTGIDPSRPAIEEAVRRSRGYGTFRVGTIEHAPLELYDVICYNFSIQYQPLELLPEITRRLSDGGILIGTVTDSTRLDMDDRIQIQKVDEDHISVFIPDTPYYANGPVVEPILHKDEFIKRVELCGLRLLLWEPFSIYAKFVFTM